MSNVAQRTQRHRLGSVVWVVWAHATSGCSVLYPFDFTATSRDAAADTPDAPLTDHTPGDALAGDAPAAPDAPVCATRQTLCGASCVNTDTDVTHCGRCDAPCAPRANASARCESGACEYTCAAGFERCGGRECAIDTRVDLANCGACDRPCATPNARPSCVGGVCSIRECIPGFDNCDRSVDNGCETDLGNSNEHCGACGRACESGSSCVMARCVSACLGTVRVCSGACVDLTSNARHCGACGNECRAESDARPRCEGGRCTIVCDAGFADCNGLTRDGCEANTNASAEHCGACGAACPGSLPNGAGSCRSGRCTLNCRSGFEDCDGVSMNGCEVSTTTTADCGGCARACAFANASATCNSGACRMGACNAGFANCDDNEANGCEASLSSLAHCGACRRACGAGRTCRGGVCV